ncbi:MAG TPA: FkbM family methyltransferase, partial [Gammaproteobacteria bacterium]|nr:FkbM family methyltransferase [Gammaproteobacteria bacterium]
GEKFDVVIVDALFRNECLIHAAEALTESGVIVLDDSDPDLHSTSIDHLESLGFRALKFEGLKPGSIKAYRTTVFYRDGNCLGI